MHLNSVYVDPTDNNYIVSFRSLDSIIKINRDNGELMWTLGGIGDEFNINDTEQFSRQHYATISINNTLTIYDNGNTNEQSRLLEYTLDGENKKILEFNSYQIDGYHGSIRGSVNRISTSENIFLAAWGQTQENRAFITEYNFDTNTKIIEFYDNTSELDSKTYRVHKYGK